MADTAAQQSSDYPNLNPGQANGNGSLQNARDTVVSSEVGA